MPFLGDGLLDRPEALRPELVRFQEAKPLQSPGIIPADRPLTLADRKAILKVIEDARVRMACSQAMLEAAEDGGKGVIK